MSGSNTFTGSIPEIKKVRVLDLSGINGLLAGHLLARIGADVIQIEPPEGHDSRRRMSEECYSESGSLWQAYGSGKKSVTLDINKDSGREVLLDLCDIADILIESAVPGEMDDLGLGYDFISERYPNLIYVSITPFGSHGPKSGYQATDLILWAAGGALLPTANAGFPPLRMSIPQSFRHASADAVTGALIALYERSQNGQGQHVDISAQVSVAQSTLSGVLAGALGHEAYSLRPKVGAKQAEPGRVRVGETKWKARDGVIELHLGSGPATGRFSNNLMEWIKSDGVDLGELADIDWSESMSYDNESTYQKIEQAHQVVAGFLKSKTKVELIDAAIGKKLLLAPVNTINDLLGSKHLDARGAFSEVRAGNSVFSMPAYLFKSEGFSLPAPGKAPEIGEHNEEVYLGMLSMSNERLGDLVRMEVV